MHMYLFLHMMIFDVLLLMIMMMLMRMMKMMMNGYNSKKLMYSSMHCMVLSCTYWNHVCSI